MMSGLGFKSRMAVDVERLVCWHPMSSDELIVCFLWAQIKE